MLQISSPEDFLSGISSMTGNGSSKSKLPFPMTAAAASALMSNLPDSLTRWYQQKNSAASNLESSFDSQHSLRNSMNNNMGSLGDNNGPSSFFSTEVLHVIFLKLESVMASFTAGAIFDVSQKPENLSYNL